MEQPRTKEDGTIHLIRWSKDPWVTHDVIENDEQSTIIQHHVQRCSSLYETRSGLDGEGQEKSGQNGSTLVANEPSFKGTEIAWGIGIGQWISIPEPEAIQGFHVPIPSGWTIQHCMQINLIGHNSMGGRG